MASYYIHTVVNLLLHLTESWQDICLQPTPFSWWLPGIPWLVMVAIWGDSISLYHKQSLYPSTSASMLVEYTFICVITTSHGKFWWILSNWLPKLCPRILYDQQAIRISVFYYLHWLGWGQGIKIICQFEENCGRISLHLSSMYQPVLFLTTLNCQFFLSQSFFFINL